VIDSGRVIAEGTRAELKASVGAGSVTLRLIDPHDRQAASDVLRGDLGVPVHPDRDPASLTARLPAEDDPQHLAGRVAHALGELSRSGIAIADFALGQPSLDEVFLALTGNPTTPETQQHEEAA
jgi:ABC-2 type transport system ATP-binding protein